MRRPVLERVTVQVTTTPTAIVWRAKGIQLSEGQEIGEGRHRQQPLADVTCRKVKAVYIQELVGAVINWNYVTNDARKISAAVSARQHVEYVCREHARFMVLFDAGTAWGALANAPPVFVVVEGTRYRRNGNDTPLSFRLPRSRPMARRDAAE